MMIPDPPSIPMPAFSQEQRDAYVAYVEGCGKARARAQGKLFSEVDFLMGASAVFFALKQNGMIPGGWVFGPLSGRSVLDPAEEGVCPKCGQATIFEQAGGGFGCHTCGTLLQRVEGEWTTT
jgi:hypothetical protein